LTSVSSQVEALSTTVNDLMIDVDAIQDSVDNLPDPADYTTELAELATGLAYAQTAISSLTTELEGAVKATNFYSKIPTALLMIMTGHSRETTFLKYIGLEKNKDSYADDFMRCVSQLEL